MSQVNQETFDAVDDYVVSTLLPFDPILDDALRRAHVAGLPSIAVSATQGKQLHLLARAIGAGRILEVGTLGGYSAIWLARALSADGHLDTLEIDPRHADVARENVAAAGLGDRVDVHVGPGVETLERMIDAGQQPYDLVFIDADKPSNAAYVRAALALSHQGTMIIVDNVVRGGAVVDPDRRDDGAVVGVRELNELIAAEPRLDATTIQTVGHKGYDGFTMALVVS